MTQKQENELKTLYHKVMIGAVTILLSLSAWGGNRLMNQLDGISGKLETLVEQVIINKKDIEHLKSKK